MKIGIIGLGKMGSAIGYRLLQNNFSVLGYDPSPEAQKHAQEEKIQITQSIVQCIQASDVLWFMIPAGPLFDELIEQNKSFLKPEMIIVDGGNSFYKDSVKRAAYLKKMNVHFIDCGTSGGIHGKENGFSLMIGCDDKKIFQKCEPVFKAIAASDGYGLVGSTGCGHYVKMIHNGIEYALLQAYAEGFQLLKEGPYTNLDLANIADIWNHGAIIRSWLLQLTEHVLKNDQEFKNISGAIQESGTGAWTVQTAHEYKIPVPTIEKSLEIRKWSRETGGNYATKLIALLRNAFGGHLFTKK